jgi:hypothetical protein
MIAASHQMYSALSIVDLKEWKNVHGKTAHTLLIETLYGQRRICARGFKFQSNGSRRICAIFFNRHAIYDHSYYEALKVRYLSRYVAALISWFTSPLLVLCLFLVPAVKEFLGRWLSKDVGVLRGFIPISFHSNKVLTTTNNNLKWKIQKDEFTPILSDIIE